MALDFCGGDRGQSANGASSPGDGRVAQRELECEQLRNRVAAAIAGEGSVVAIEGKAGIGKSTLLAYAAQCAQNAGMRSLSARGGELEHDFGYGVVRQLFDVALAAMPATTRQKVLSGPAGLAGSALSVPGSSRPSAEPGSVLHGLYWLSANLAAEEPLLIVVDDAHWADTASIAFLSYLARRVEGLALLVVYATRMSEGSSESLPGAAEPGLVKTTIRPAALSERATGEIIGRLLEAESCDAFSRACHVATTGNPFLLRELMRALRADGIPPERNSANAWRGLSGHVSPRSSPSCGGWAAQRPGSPAPPRYSARALSCATRPRSRTSSLTRRVMPPTH